MASSTPTAVGRKASDSDTSCNTMHSANTYLLRTGLVESVPIPYAPLHVDSQKNDTAWLITVAHQLFGSPDDVVRTGAHLVTSVMQSSERCDRLLATGICQVLLDEKILKLTGETFETNGTHFSDTDTISYRFISNTAATSNSPASNSTSHLHVIHDAPSSASRTPVITPETNRSVRSRMPKPDEQVIEGTVNWYFERLYHLAADTLFRNILTKPTDERSGEELEFIFQELLFIPSLSKLSTSVRHELSKCILYQINAKEGDMVFKQGDPGTSWYIIYRGSVWVHIDGKGNVCRMKEGDDFGKLALVTDAPRAGSIILAEDDCHFLQVEKADFDRILRDVEANIIRLREEDSDVLILERVPTVALNDPDVIKVDVSSQTNNATNGCSNYSIIAGTLEKIITHILNLRLKHLRKKLIQAVNMSNFTHNSIQLQAPDNILEVFFLTYTLYTSADDIIACIVTYLQSSTSDSNLTESLNCDNVVTFLYIWCLCVGLPAFASISGMEHFFTQITNLLSGLYHTNQPSRIALDKLAVACSHIWLPKSDLNKESNGSSENRVDINTSSNSSRSFFPQKTSNKWFLSGNLNRISEGLSEIRINTLEDPTIHDFPSVFNFNSSVPITRFIISPNCLPLVSGYHQITMQIYVFPSRSPTSITSPISATVADVKRVLLNQLAISATCDDYALVEVLSKGDHVVFKDAERGFMFSMSPNSCLFIVKSNEIRGLAPLPIQLSVAMKYLDETRLTVEGNQKETLFSRGSPIQKQPPLARPLDHLTLEEVANCLTLITASLAVSITAEELIDHTVGSLKSGQPTPHVRLLIDQFSVVHAWTITQIVTTSPLTKRVQLVKKLITLANILISPPLCNQHTCFAIVLALQSSPISRLTHTWERISAKWRNVYYNQLLPLTDPSRNHRTARSWLMSTDSPCLPFIALTLKDLRFAEDANETYYQETSSTQKLINFEKSTLIARSLQVWKKAVQGYTFLHPQSESRYVSSNEDVSTNNVLPLMLRFASVTSAIQLRLTEQLECVDDIKVLTQLSLLQEPKK